MRALDSILSERQKERDRETERQRDRKTERQKDRETERQLELSLTGGLVDSAGPGLYIVRETERERQRDRETERQKDRKTERQRDRETGKETVRSITYWWPGRQCGPWTLYCWRVHGRRCCSCAPAEGSPWRRTAPEQYYHDHDHHHHNHHHHHHHHQHHHHHHNH